MQQLTTFALFGLLVLLLSRVRPGAGRIFMGIFFLVMAIGVNGVLVAPNQFVALGTDAAIIPLYRWFFDTLVALALLFFGLLAAAYETTIALMMLSKGNYVTWGLIGGIAFLIGITPLGVWTLANPILTVAMAYLLTKEYERCFPEMLHLTARLR